MKNRALVFSLILNGILLTLFVFKNSFDPKTPPQPVSILNQKNIQEELEKYLHQEFLPLVLELNDDHHIEEGIKYQDLALSVLVSKFDFDIERLLEDVKRSYLEYIDLKTQMRKKLVYIKNMDKDKFTVLSQFGLKEKYPMTSQGLLTKIKQGNRDEALLHAFFLTKECEWFFSVMGYSNRMACLNLLMDVDFSLLKTLYQTYCMQPAQDLGLQIGMDLCFKGHSMRAANDLLDKYFDDVTKRFSDEQLLKLMTLFSKKTPQLVPFATKMLNSNRSQKVHMYAALLLFQYFDLEVPEPFDLESALTILKLTLRDKFNLEEERKGNIQG